MLFEKVAKKRAYNVKRDDGYWLGIIDYSKSKKSWGFTPDADTAFNIESLKEILRFLESLKGTEGDELVC